MASSCQLTRGHPGAMSQGLSSCPLPCRRREVPGYSLGFPSPCGASGQCCTPSRGIPLDRPSRIPKQGRSLQWTRVTHHSAVLRATSSHQPCRGHLGVLLSTGALGDHCPQSKQGHTLHRSCRPYSTDEVSTSSACREERPCEHRCAGLQTGMAAQGPRACVLLAPWELPGGAWGGKGLPHGGI